MHRRGFLAACAAAGMAGCNALGAGGTGAPLAWQFDSEARLGGLSVADDGRVYLTGRVPGGTGVRLLELAAASGEPTVLSRVETGATVRVLAAAGAVYRWVDPLGVRTGTLVVTDQGGGRLWHHGNAVAPPAVADGLAYVRGRRVVHARSARTGNRWWRLRLDEAPLLQTRRLVAPETWGRLFLSGPAGVASVDTAGARQWAVAREAETAVPLAVGERTVYVGDAPLGDRATVSAHAPGGRTRWRTTVPGGYAVPTPAPLGTYVTTWTADGTVLVALRAGEGGRSWRVEGVRFGALLRGGVACVDEDAAVVLAHDGTERWRFEPSPDPPPSVWRLGDGLLVVAGSAATALSPRGTVRWEYETDAPVEDAVVEGERAYLLTDRRVHALG